MKKRLLSWVLAGVLLFQSSAVEAAVIPGGAQEPQITAEAEVQEIAGEVEQLFPEFAGGENLPVAAKEGEGLFQEGYLRTPVRVTQEDSQLIPGEITPNYASGDARTGDPWEEWDALVYEQLKKRAEEIDVSKFQMKVGQEKAWYQGVINEHPELYFVSGGYRYGYNSDNITTKIIPEYKTQEFDNDKFEFATKEALSVLEEGMTDVQKAIALHEYLVLNCEYDYDNLKANTLPESVFTAYGVLVNRTAVCQGYALTYKYLLQKAGIECYMVSSASLNHAWNMLKLDGKLYQVDVTWDDPVYDSLGLVRHGNMFVSDSVFRERQKHTGTDWVITYKGNVLDVTASDTTYDEYFWTGVNSPLVYGDGKYYYVKTFADAGNANKITCTDWKGMSSVAISEDIGKWAVKDKEGYYYTAAFSGLFLLGDRLYFNSSTEIRSIMLDGTNVRTEFDGADTEDDYRIYGLTYYQEKVSYVLQQEPNTGEKLPQKVCTATLSGAVGVSRVALSDSKLRLRVGTSATLTAQVSPTIAADKTLTWSSSDDNIATVSETGQVMAIAEGSCAITATAGGKSAECAVTVVAESAPLEKLEAPVFSLEAGSVEKGTEITITAMDGATIYYTTNGTVPTTASNQYTAKIVVDKDMTIKAYAVKAGYEDSEVASATYQIKVIDVSQVQLNKTQLSLRVGTSETLTAQVSPANATDKTLTWSSSGESIATVSETGEVTAAAEGSCTITATAGGKSAECAVTVVSESASLGQLDAPVFSPEAGSVEKGTEITITAMDGATIYYTTDGTTPTAASNQYTSKIVVDKDMTIKAYAVREGYEDSEIASATYQIKGIDVSQVQLNKTQLSLRVGISETLTAQVSPANATDKTLTWSSSDESIATVSETGEVTAVAAGSCTITVTATGGKSAECAVTVTSESTKLEKLEAPVFSPAAGSVEKGTEITITAMDGATIYYTTDGTVPTTASSQYTAKIVVDKDMTIKAYAVREGYEDSEVATAVYQIKKTENAVNTESPEDIEDNYYQTAERTNLKDVNATIAPIKSKVYDGKAYLPTVKVTATVNGKTVTLVEGTDYRILYKNNINAGTGKVIIKGNGLYTGEKEADFEITPKQLSKLKVVVGDMALNSVDEPPVCVYDGTKLLKNKTDYKLTYDKSIAATKGKKNVTVEEMKDSNYAGSKKVTVNVCEAEKILKAENVTLLHETMPYTGKAIKENVPQVKYGTEVLTLNQHYKVSYQNNKNAGTAFVIITGKGEYTGKVVKSFQITPIVDTKLEVAPIPAKTYNGKAQKPAVSVKSGGKKLAKNKDYTVFYTGNVHKGTAKVTITGKGNYLGSRAVANFEIGAQKISKASLKGNRETGLTLTYNKKALKEGTDYQLTYDEASAQNNKIQVTVDGLGDFAGTSMIKIVGDGKAAEDPSKEPSKEPSKATPKSSTNVGKQNYSRWAGTVNSYLTANADGTFMRVECIDRKVWTETYQANGTCTAQKEIPMELPIFGGFYAGKDAYFLVFGKQNSKEDDKAEVIRVVKYDKAWNKKGACSLYGANTNTPFEAGSLRMTESGGMLYVRTCHKMYKSNDGLNHQSNLTFSVRTSDMVITDQFTIVMNIAYGYVSHSFNQFILADGETLVAADHGDAYPRSAVLIKYPKAAGGEKFLDGESGKYLYEKDRCSYVDVLPIQGQTGANATGVSVGGFAASETSYLVVGNSVPQADSASYNAGAERNIFVTSTKKDAFSEEGTTVHWITNYKDKEGKAVSTPQLVEISKKEFLLLWTEKDGKVKGVLLDASGKATTGIYSMEGKLSDCKPIVDGDSVVWYYTSASAPKFLRIKLADVRKA